MKKAFFLIFLIPLLLQAQLDEDYEYEREFVWGPNKNTNGGLIGSLVFKWSRSTGDDWFRTFGFELSNVKHRKEKKLTRETGKSFIIGKTNYLYTLRLQYGREKLLFRKDNQQGVQINAGVMGGPTIGFHAPYFIQINDGSYEKYDPFEPQNIIGPGRLFQGLGQSESVFGAHVKGGISFEFGTYKNNVAGMEFGFMMEAFSKEIVLVPTQPNKSFFPSTYVTLYWGGRK